GRWDGGSARRRTRRGTRATPATRSRATERRKPWPATLSRRSERHHRPDRRALVHQVEGSVDVGEGHGVGDHVVDGDLAVHVPIHDLRDVGPPLGSAEGGPLPHSPRDELKGTRRDLLARPGDADDYAGAPTLVAALERLAHRLD